MTKPVETRDRYPLIVPVQTRWSDNDLYGHVNNVTYYSYFDSVVNRYLIDHGGLDIHNAPIIGLAVETHCQFRASVAYPEALEAGLRVGKLGKSSVRYEIGIFRAGENEVAAWGHFIHVFCVRATSQPVPIPDPIRAALAKITVEH